MIWHRLHSSHHQMPTVSIRIQALHLKRVIVAAEACQLELRKASPARAGRVARKLQFTVLNMLSKLTPHEPLTGLTPEQRLEMPTLPLKCPDNQLQQQLPDGAPQ
jgi:hypothetical protein